jgi:hypothetical protein
MCVYNVLHDQERHHGVASNPTRIDFCLQFVFISLEFPIYYTSDTAIHRIGLLHTLELHRPTPCTHKIVLVNGYHTTSRA